MFGALVFVMVAWLAFDAYSIRKDFLTASRGIGFLFLAFSQVMNVFSFEAETYQYIGFSLYLFGLVLVVWNLFLEKPVERPSLSNYAILVLPPIATLAFYINFWVIILHFLIAFLSYKQYKKEDKKTLYPFILAFSLLTISSFFGFFYTKGYFNTVWVIGNIFQFSGFVFLAVWVWQYMQLRIREEMVMIFFSFTLLISIVVTFAFSMILVDQIETAIKTNLVINAKSMDYLILHLKEEALSKSRLFSSNVELREAIYRNNFSKIESLSDEFMKKENLGFLTVADSEGNVILRAHATTKRNDNILKESPLSKSVDGYSVSTIGPSDVEGFSIRSSSPVILNGKVIGFVLAGFPMDNPFIDNLKKITGLDISVLEGDKFISSTIIGPDGRSRISGIKLNDPLMIKEVLVNGNIVTSRSEIVYKPYLVSYFPLKNIDNNIVGMFSIARSQREIFAIANTTNILTLVSVIIIMFILAFPIFVITKRLLND